MNMYYLIIIRWFKLFKQLNKIYSKIDILYYKIYIKYKFNIQKKIYKQS